LSYLNRVTKSNPKLIVEMIKIYLNQTPTLIKIIKKSMIKKDWGLMSATAHKIIPSFYIMGIDSKFEEIAIRVQDYSYSSESIVQIEKLVNDIEIVCLQACF